jgi:hypothetical protein
MTQPDNFLIAQVMMYLQGLRNAEDLARRVVFFFTSCNERTMLKL